MENFAYSKKLNRWYDGENWVKLYEQKDPRFRKQKRIKRSSKLLRLALTKRRKNRRYSSDESDTDLGKDDADLNSGGTNSLKQMVRSHGGVSINEEIQESAQIVEEDIGSNGEITSINEELQESAQMVEEYNDSNGDLTASKSNKMVEGIVHTNGENGDKMTNPIGKDDQRTKCGKGALMTNPTTKDD